MLVGELQRPVDAAAGRVDQPQAAERQRHRVPPACSGDVDQLEAAAAEIAGDPVGLAKAHQMPLAASSASRSPERIWIGSPAATSPRAMKSGPSSASRTAAVAMARTFLTPRMRVIGAEAGQRRQRALHAVAAELAGAGDGAAEAAQHLLVEQRRRAAHRALVDDEAHRVRADVDDADRLELVEEPPFAAAPPGHSHPIPLTMASPPTLSAGESAAESCPLSDWPRPKGSDWS